jgi:outer membrane protein insertion porin family
MWSIARPGTGARIAHRAWLATLFGVAAIAVLVTPATAQRRPLIVRSVSFQGNNGVDPEFLAASIATTQSAFFQRNAIARSLTFGALGEPREFNQLEFVKDVYRLRIAFKSSGYPNVVIDTLVRRTQDAIDITFRITEGEPVRLHSLEIVGLDSVVQAAQVRLDLPIAPGDIASDYRLHEARDTIEGRLRNRGYATATVVYLEQDHAATENARFEVHTGRYSRFGPISVAPDPGVDTALVASLMATRPGSEYRETDILLSQRNLYTSDLFRTVAIDTAITGATVAIAVRVTPSLGHRAKASAGYGTDDCFRVGAGWTSRNFPGSGLVFDVTGQLSKIGVGNPLGLGFEHNVCGELANDSVGSRVANYGLNASLRRNAFLSPNNSAVLSVFATQHSEFEVYLRQEIGASFSITRTTAANVPITLAYRIADGTTTANPASFCAFFNTCDPAAIAALQQRRLQGTLTLSILRQHINNPFDPSRGSILSASVTTSSRFLGSSATQQFTRFIGDASGFVPIVRNVVLAGHFRAGVIVAPTIALGADNGNFVPPDQRFYAGGANDVRGYDQNQLGPVVYVVPADSVHADPAIPGNPLVFNSSATRVAPTGGTKVAIGNLEIRFPTPLFAGRLKAAVFVDGGMLSTDGETSPVRITPGFGLRYTSPLGAIRFDAAYNEYPLQSGRLYSISTDGSLTKLQENFLRQQSPHLTFHFSIGQAF